MHVRHALPIPSDIDAIVAMAQRFYAETHYAALVPMPKEQAAGLAIVLMEPGRGVVLVAEHEDELVGVVALLIEPFTFNPSVRMATELVWWVNPEARETGAGQALLEEIEPACRQLEVDFIRMQTLHSSPPHAAALYKRRGYVPTEHAFTKEIR